MSVDSPVASRPTAAVRFMLDADATPGLLSRLLQPFAKRDLVPDRMWSHRAGDTMHVEIAMEAMPDDAVHVVEGNLRQVIGVRSMTQVRPEAMRRAA
jgi:acetolactate synthase regulatory subunit